MTTLRTLSAFLLAAVLATLAGSVAHSLFVLSALQHAGARLGEADWSATILHDIAGMGPSYGGIIAIALAAGLGVAAAANRVARLPRPIAFLVAGGAAVAVALILMKQVVYGITPIAGARTTAGFSAQVLIGAVAGFVFALATPPPRREI